MKPWTFLAAAILVGGSLVSGCSNTADGVKKDTEQAGENVSSAANTAADRTAESASKMGQEASKVANNAGDALSDFASDASIALTVTPKVKTAITADPQLNDSANKIDVDSKDRVVHLKGTVATNELKAKAGSLAKQALTGMKAPSDIKVSNELVVQKR